MTRVAPNVLARVILKRNRELIGGTRREQGGEFVIRHGGDRSRLRNGRRSWSDWRLPPLSEKDMVLGFTTLGPES